MTKKQIHRLIAKGKFPETTQQVNLVETHISWVILCDQFVYKIKKPIKYSFLDFSTLELRRHFCERELELNQRFASNIYLEVMPIRHFEFEDRYCVGGGEDGTIIDYCLKMKKLVPEKQMDLLLLRSGVSETDIQNLAERVADFHKGAVIINEKDVLDVREKFNDLGLEKEFLSQKLDLDAEQIISHAIEFSNAFLDNNKELLESRQSSGFFRDCHGDLHTRNIFLLPEPQPFDCIEFNDDYRQIDVLNEVAFLCMDLDTHGRNDLSEVFITHYNRLFPAIRNKEERSLFIYYKSYRANVRAKVNSLRAKSASDTSARTKALVEAEKYLLLMDGYIKSVNDSQMGSI